MSGTYSIRPLLPVRGARLTSVRRGRPSSKAHSPLGSRLQSGFFNRRPSDFRQPVVPKHGGRNVKHEGRNADQDELDGSHEEGETARSMEAANDGESHLLSSLDAAMAANATPPSGRSSKPASRPPMKPPSDLSRTKQTVVITGGSGAIGLAIAQAFAKQDHPVILCGRNETKLNDHRAMLGGPKDEHDILVGDITSNEFVAEQLPAMMATRFNHTNEQGDRSAALSRMPSILVNCAGITQYTGLATTKDAAIEEILATNLLATIRISKFFVKQFIKNKQYYKKLSHGTTKLLRPHIINISSLLATHGGTGATVYAASKAGMLGFTRSLAAELSGKGIRVNAILPGYIDSEMTGKFSDKYKQGLEKTIPAGRFGHPGEIANAAMFLAYNQYCNGCEIRVDGGLGAVIGVGDA